MGNSSMFLNSFHADDIRAEMESLQARYAKLADELQRIEAQAKRAAKERSDTEAHVLSRFESGHWIVHGMTGKPWWCAPGNVLYEQATPDEFSALERLIDAGIIERVHG